MVKWFVMNTMIAISSETFFLRLLMKVLKNRVHRWVHNGENT